MMSGGGTAGPPPLIRADGAPNKVAVAQSDTASKQIYDRFGGDKSQNEKVVSREEQPVDVKPAQARPSFAPSAGNNGSAQPAWPAPAGANNPPAPTGGANAANEPRRIKTVPIRADQLASAPATAEQPPVPSAPPPTQPAARAEPKPAVTQRQATSATSASSNGPMSLTPQGSTRTAAASPRAAETAASGAYVVQLAAHKTQDEASAAFRSAQSRYPSILGSQKLLIKRKEVAGHGTFYGAQVGPFASRSDAVSLCESLKSAGGDCIVQRN
jgi:hypothetical protein